MARIASIVLRALLRRRGLVRSESGATVAEFALILPVFLLFVGGMIEGGLLLHTWGRMEHVGRQAARAFAIGAVTKDEAESFIASEMQKGAGALVVTPSVTTNAGANALEDQVVVRITVASSELSKMLPFRIFRLTSLEAAVRLRLET
jgi:Flp pilus assembly protein TadG